MIHQTGVTWFNQQINVLGQNIVFLSLGHEFLCVFMSWSSVMTKQLEGYIYEDHPEKTNLLRNVNIKLTHYMLYQHSGLVTGSVYIIVISRYHLVRF